MAAEPPPSSSGRICAVCGATLGRHEVTATCASLACRTTLATRAQAARDRIRRDDLQAAIARFADPSAAVGVVPAFERRLVPADPERVALFRQSLIDAVAGATAPAGCEPEPEQERDAFVARTMGAACGACRGACCDRGGTHAFLTAEEIALQLARWSSRTGEDLVAWYMARLPAESYEHSCVFQGERGCVLDRPARARICNAYLCQGLHELEIALREDPDRSHVAAIADGRIQRTVSLDRDAPAA